MNKHLTARILALTVLLSLCLMPSAFAQEPAPVPSAEELAEGYFLPVSRVEFGTAGSSLKQAAAACRTVQFALDHSLGKADRNALQQNMLQAWQSLSGEDQAAFSDMMSTFIAPLLERAFDDYSSLSGLFESAGVESEMSALVNDPGAKDAWAVLSESTAAAQQGESSVPAVSPAPESELTLWQKFLRLLGLK